MASNLPTLKQGKPSNAIRQQGRDLLAQKGILDHLSRIAMGEVGEIVYDKEGQAEYCATPIKDQVKAIDTLLKYSIGANRDLTEADVRMRVSKTVEKIAEILPEDEARRVLSAIEPFWTG